MSSPWFIPDAEQWRTEEDYNPAVVDALNCVAQKLAQDGGVESTILDCVSPIIGARMSKSQRLRVLYVVCLCMAAEDPPDAALPPLREAIALAKELDESRARIDLLMQRAYVNRYINQIPDAVANLRECLEAFEELKRRGEWIPDDTTRILTTTVRLATFEFAIGEVEASQESLQRAEKLLAQVGEHIDSQARLSWLRALVARWSGAYQQALAEGVAAIGYYQQMRDPEMLSRIEGMTGEILLDLADQSRAHGDEEACAEYLVRAESYIQRAIQIAVASDYQASECMARIIRSRLVRLQGAPGDRTLLLEELANMARQHRDMALVCKAYTDIGQECEAVGKFDEAKEWYRRAIAALKESKAVADTVWAQRALWRLEGEMDADDHSVDPPDVT
jgi:tetratricopeptide (TPR) repeat protein